MWCPSFPIPSPSPTLPSAKHSLVSVTGKLQRRNPSQNSTRDTPPPLGHTSLTTLNTNQRRNNSPIKSPGSEEQQQSREQFGLSGSDVLFALQRATTQKAKIKKKKKPRDPHSSPSDKRRGGSGSEGEEDDLDYSNVRPICVKPDWGSRLDELEKRLLELIDRPEA